MIDLHSWHVTEHLHNLNFWFHRVMINSSTSMPLTSEWQKQL
jgi:hypothetical protein